MPKNAFGLTSRISFAVVALAAASAVRASNWQPKAGGSFVWNANGNWDSAFPNAAGAVANLDVGLTGGESIALNQQITVGTLNLGDTGGTAGVTTSIASGSGGRPLTLQGATPGAPTAINVNLAATASTFGNTISLPDITLGGTSPLTITLHSPALGFCAMGNITLNSNTLTIAGDPYLTEEIASAGVEWTCNGVTGTGNIVVNGAGLDIDNALSGFTGSVTVNSGMLGLYGNGNLKTATSYTLGGAWNDFSKYPKGGLFRVGNPGSPTYTSVQDRLNHNAPMIFKSGFLEYVGQALTPSLAGTAVVEQVKQMQFINGMSQIRMQDGNNVAVSSTLLCNDPNNACVRMPGATAMIGGDDDRSRDGNYPLAMGVGEKLIFASGMAQYLKGAGGPDGSMSKSIIPWMTDGTIYHPGQGRFMTYDNTNGLRCLTSSEYYFVPNTGSVLGIDPTYNVSTMTDREATTSILNLGTNHTQTINSLTNESRLNSDIGQGSTLTVTSGEIEFLGPAKIGADRATAGTLNFGSAEGIIWTDFESLYGSNQIGSTIAGSGGLTMAGNNILLITGVNVYTGKTSVGSGIMQVGDGVLTDCRLGNGDVEVAAGGTLRIAAKVANAISDAATVSLDDNGDVYFGTMDLAAGINETVASLILNGAIQPAGTYGSSASLAGHKLDNYFTGAGMLTVAPVPEPATIGLLALGGLGLIRRRREGV